MASSDDEPNVPTVVRPSASDDPTLLLTPSAATGRFPPGAVLGNRYRIVAMLGRGGMGEVYRADDLRLGQQVALKFLSRDSATAADHDRLLQEVRIGREISHPNVCRLYDIADVEGRLCIAMEYVDGEDLASLLRRIGRLPPDKALTVARDLCGGLAAAHEKGVVHRDLKPANVMIDGRGRARITDFGLAVAIESAHGSTGGTPAYMAPEQLAGTPASVRSDIFALGLVLFEIFSGRRAVEGHSIGEISERHKTLLATSLSRIVPGIDSQIEKAIYWCLASDPGQRPASADEIARALPERDPLAAALAAGETPSPSVVADAGAVGDLRHRAAWTALAMTIVGIAAVALLAQRTMVYHLVKLPKRPEVLQHTSEEIAGLIAPAGSVADRASWMEFDGWRVGEGSEWPLDAAPSPFLFNYRQSPRPLVGKNLEFRVFWNDPPLDVSEQVNVRIDAEGRLMELVVVPPQRIETPNAPASAYDWQQLLAKTGLETASLRPDVPRWTAPVDSDAKKAWTGRYPGGRGEVRIEAASYRGRPVWLSVLMPWAKATRMGAQSHDPMMRLVVGVQILFLIVLPVAAIFSARRNLRRGQGDTRGALMFGGAVAVLIGIASLLRLHHPASFRAEWTLLSQLTANVSFWGAMVALMYIAIEPFIRKRWPEMLISWSRLVAGRWRDPMIGRDLLIGVAAGVSIVVLTHALAIAEWSLMPRVVSPLKVATAFGSVNHVAYFLVRAIVEALLRSLAVVSILVLMRRLLRVTWLAAAITIMVIAAGSLDLALGTPVARAITVLTAGIGAVTLMIRFGLLAVSGFAYAYLVLTYLPITFDPSRWFFGRSLLMIATVIALAGFSFYVSLGKKPLLPRAIFEE